MKFNRAMTYEEYEQKVEELESEFNEKKNELSREFAMANNPYKVGDILQDHYQIIRVEKIKWKWAFLSIISECVYYGTQLTAKLEPKKRQDINPCMYQSNVLRKLN